MSVINKYLIDKLTQYAKHNIIIRFNIYNYSKFKYSKCKNK